MGDSSSMPDSIGVATMDVDGTLVLRLRAEGPRGIIGDGVFVYPPMHPEYARVVEHLGNVKPGESCPVPPWPDGR